MQYVSVLYRWWVCMLSNMLFQGMLHLPVDPGFIDLH